jgi:hypothetical protein
LWSFCVFGGVLFDCDAIAISFNIIDVIGQVIGYIFN